MLQPQRSIHRPLLAATLIIGLTFAAVPFAGAAPSAVLIIDHFDTAQGPLTASLGVPAASSVSGANVIGAERDLQVSVVSGSPGNAKVEALNSTLAHSQDSGVIAQTLVQWDGADGAIALNPTGLGGVDLTQGNTQNGLVITVLLNDLPIELEFTVYSGANSSTTTLTLPGGQPTGAGPKNYYIPYAAFTTLAGTGANFASVGAIELLIDGVNDATDLTIGVIETAEFDWGDLPDSSVGGPNYPTKFAVNGPRHVIGNLFLGASVDPFELNGAPTTPANGDDVSGADDEDGVAPTPAILWQTGANGGSIDVTVTGGPGCFSGWIDWNNDGDFADGGENILSNVSLAAGSSTQTFFVPVSPDSGSFYARFRLYAPDSGGGCATVREPIGQAVNGEVEDYLWSFGPNAVNLSSFGATASPASLPVIGGVLAALGAGVVALRRFLRL
jgi:hypothetical protein